MHLFNLIRFFFVLEKERLIPGPDTLCPEDQDQQEAEQQNIFFLETSGEECLTARQACSIESASRANPNAIVTVYMEVNGSASFSTGPHGWKAKHQHLPGQRRSCAITNQLFQSTNVKLIREDLVAVHSHGTPLWQLTESGSLDQSQFPMAHRSDVVRVAILWKRGGLYLDLDCIVLRPLHCLRNTVGLVDFFISNWAENGVITFDAGHPFLDHLMWYMNEEFKPDSYISLGPPTLSYALQDFCNRDDLPPNQPLHCHHNATIVLQSKNAFYALSQEQLKVFYKENPSPDEWSVLAESYLTHVYNAGHGTTVPEGSFYSLLAREYCPITHQMSFMESGHF